MYHWQVMDNDRSSYVSGILVSIFVSFFFPFLFMYIYLVNTKIIQYKSTSKVAQKFEITFLEAKQEKSLPAVAAREKSEPVFKPTKVKTSVKDLFKKVSYSVDTKVKKKKKISQDFFEKLTVNKKIDLTKGKKISNIDTQSLLKKTNKQKKILDKEFILEHNGQKVDAYIQKIEAFIYSKWIPSQDLAGFESTIKLVIDTKNGRLKEKPMIIYASLNMQFDQELNLFLNTLLEYSFPKEVNGKIRTIKINFKAEE